MNDVARWPIEAYTLDCVTSGILIATVLLLAPSASLVDLYLFAAHLPHLLTMTFGCFGLRRQSCVALSITEPILFIALLSDITVVTGKLGQIYSAELTRSTTLTAPQNSLCLAIGLAFLCVDIAVVLVLPPLLRVDAYWLTKTHSHTQRTATFIAV